jgi:hypothetical protein
VKSFEFYLNKTAIELLKDALQVRPPYFMCFGKYHSYLDRCGFIDEENQVTPLGKQFLMDCYSAGYFDKDTVH